MSMALLKPFFLFMHVIFLLGLLYGSPFVAGFVQSSNETDRAALLAFKAAITSDPFGALNSWNESTHFCQWVGVTCGRQHKRVTVLQLDHQKLGGSLSPHIGNLSFLRELWVLNNSLSHAIPHELGRLQRLRMISLLNNTITGEIPASLKACSNLVVLELTGNMLTGEIPPELGSLTLLKELYVAYNSLTGEVPSTFGNLSSLTVLFASKNVISGNIPDALCQLKSLEYLALAENNLVGTIPSSILNISSLRLLQVSGNQIQGNLPSELGNTLRNLEIFAVSDNLLTGSIPISLSNTTNIHYFGAASNKLTGKVPPLEKLNGLEHLRLHSNQLGSGEADDLSFLNSLINATFLQSLDLNNNNFGGLLPESISNFSTDLYRLNFFVNNIIGNIPTGIGNLVNLQSLGMSDNYLSGNIPADIGRLQKLQILDLDHNKLQEYGTGNKVSTYGDVYSYGILLMEMFTGKRPTDSMFTDTLTLHNFSKMALHESLESILDPTLLPQGQMGEANTNISSVDNQSSLSPNKIHQCLISLLQIGIACSEEQPTDRPNMNEVVNRLHKIKNTLLGSGVRGGKISRIAA